jgi:arabinofuranosyltransferase
MDERISRHMNKIIVASLILAFAIILFRNAWIGDDAYITFRTIDNFINGFGLRWNIAERVQTYTHPLWLMLMTVFYFVTNEAFYTCMAVSLAISIAAVLIFAVRISKTTVAACLGILALMLSKSFVDYSTSGLENPLTHLIIVIFFGLLFKYNNSRKYILPLSFIACLGTLNRMDNIILFAPVLAYLFWKNRSFRTVSIMALGFTPFIAWELFSSFYYGFFFPNTAYAKLNTGIPWPELAGQGLHYLWNSISIDPLTVVLILSAIIIPLFTRRWREITISFGILLYVVYIIKIGGCFMTGRMLAAPFLCAIVLLSQYMPPWRRRYSFIPICIILVLGLISDFSPVYTTSGYGGETERYRFEHGIVDERGWYFQSSSLLNIHPDKEMPNHRYAELGRSTTSPAIMTLIIGYQGYYAPNETHILDRYALADPLLARLPISSNKPWRIGHFERPIPPGYAETIGGGTNVITDPKLSEYYEKLKYVTRGDLFDWDRLTTIIAFNLGAYDHYIDFYWREN